MGKNQFHFHMEGAGDHFYCYFKIDGHLTHHDYETLIPNFEAAISNIKEPHVKMLVDIVKLEGWDLQAAWDDLKFGLKHNNDFEKIAVVGHEGIYEYGVKVANWFTHYEMEYFHDLAQAKQWLKT
jgi:hypothetical protein